MRKIKKGATLLEVVIGLAIIGIMLLPLANGLVTSVRANKKAEETQEAKLLGQQVVEKLKIIDGIGSNKKFDFQNGEIKFSSGVLIPGKEKRWKYGISSTGTINGYEIKGEIREEEGVTSINDSYEGNGSYQGANIKEDIGLYIQLDKTENDEIKIKYMEGTSSIKTLEDFLYKNLIDMKEEIISKNQKLNLNIKIPSIGKVIVECNGKEIKNISNPDFKGVIMIYTNNVVLHLDNKPSVNINVENRSSNFQEVQLLRDIKVSKDDFSESIKLDLKGKLNSHNNILYDANNSKRGLYSVDLKVLRDGKIVETTFTQFYLGR